MSTGNLVPNGGFDSMTTWPEAVNAQWVADDALQCTSSGSMQIGDSGYIRSACFSVVPTTTYNFGFSTKAPAAASLICAVYWFTGGTCTNTASVERTNYFENTVAGSWAPVVTAVTAPADGSFSNIFCVRNGTGAGGNIDMVFLKTNSSQF